MTRHAIFQLNRAQSDRVIWKKLTNDNKYINKWARLIFIRHVCLKCVENKKL